MIYLCYEYKNKIIKTKSKSFIDENNYNVNKIAFSLKQSLMKKFKITLEEYANYLGFNIHRCGFCGEFAKIDIEIKFENYKKRKEIIITKVTYPNNYYCKGQNENCDGKNYNPNSIVFVSKTRNIDNDNALILIHERNKSPFYSENYKNIDDYKNYQSLENRLTKEKYLIFIKNLKNSKTIEYYIDKFGKDNGELIWKNINNKKNSMSFDYFLKKNNFDYEKSIIEYKNRIRSICPNIKNFGNYSPASFNFFKKLLTKIKITNYLFGKNELILEYFDENNKKRKFYYDFVDLDNNIIIEYNGLIWHPNKEKMSNEQLNKWYFPFNKSITVEDLNKKDEIKEKVALDNNYVQISIWDCDNDDHNINIIIELYKKLNIIKND